MSSESGLEASLVFHTSPLLDRLQIILPQLFCYKTCLFFLKSYLQEGDLGPSLLE